MKLKQTEVRDLIAYLRTLLPKGKVVTKRKPAPVAPTVFHPRFGIDYAWGLPSARALRSAGVTFVARYLAPMPNGKVLRRQELRALHAMGIPVVTVWESTADRTQGGFAAGKEDAERALKELHDLGAPAHAVVFFAVDEEALRVPVDYFKGAKSVLGVSRTGVYADFKIVRALLDHGLCQFAWQTYAWSGGAWDHRAQLRQFSNDHTIGGVGCDFDRAIHPNFGQW